MYTRLLFLFLILHLGTRSFCQTTISEGMIEFGLISAKFIEDEESKVTPEMLEQMTKGIREKMNMKFFWNENYVTVLKPLLDQDTLTSIYDLKHGKVYTLKEIMGEAGYTVEKMQDYSFTGLDIPQGEPYEEPLFGLNCFEIVIENPGISTTKMYTSKEIDFTNHALLSEFQSKHGFIVRTEIVSDGVQLIIGVKHLESSVNNESIFKIDTLNRSNFTSTAKGVIENFEKISQSVNQVKEDFGEFNPQATNHFIIQNIINDGWIESDNYSFSYILKDSLDIDKPSILRLLLSESDLLEKEQELIEATLDTYKLNSPKVKALLKHPNWKASSTNLKINAITIGYAQDYIQDASVRRQLISNLTNAQLLEEETDEITNLYIQGEINLGEVLRGIKYFKPLKGNHIIKGNQLLEEIKYFFSLFEQEFPKVEVTQSEDYINISQGLNQHRILIDDLKSYEYSYSTESIEQDTFYVDFNFYNNLVPILKQIGADNDPGIVYSIYQYNDNLHKKIDEYDLEEISTTFPELIKLPSNIFLIRFKSGIVDPLIPLGLSFDYHPVSENEELRLESPFSEVLSAVDGYITTDTKKDFINFFNERSEIYGFNNVELNEITSRIMHSLISDPEELLSHIPNLKISCNIIHKIEPRSRYKPKFSPERNDFKDAYPSIYNVVKDDFIATDFTYDSENHKVQFKYKDQLHTIDPGKINMLDFIRDKMKENKFEKYLFFKQKFSVTTKEYYYLSHEDADQLRKILALKI